MYRFLLSPCLSEWKRRIMTNGDLVSKLARCLAAEQKQLLSWELGSQQGAATQPGPIYSWMLMLKSVLVTVTRSSKAGYVIIIISFSFCQKLLVVFCLPNKKTTISFRFPIVPAPVSCQSCRVTFLDLWTVSQSDFEKKEVSIKDQGRESLAELEHILEGWWRRPRKRWDWKLRDVFLLFCFQEEAFTLLVFQRRKRQFE